jgi:hypothetical protein
MTSRRRTQNRYQRRHRVESAQRDSEIDVQGWSSSHLLEDIGSQFSAITDLDFATLQKSQKGAG